MSDTKKKKGRSKKSPDEIRAAYRKLTNAIGLEGLKLFVIENEADPNYGRSVVLGSDGNILFSNVSGTELVSACERAFELCRYATRLHTNRVNQTDETEEAAAKVA
ncbi:hypothetical protein LCGC14_0941620 [marine sediment metagenome]|uniref:Uncharacterized protein n=1 Tax=marine sediment metagenome TaxID=412755 RepID=A0A0F9R3J9_9ZZZZ